MQNTAQRGAGSDESTRRRIFGRMDPSSGLLSGSVRTSSCVLRQYRTCPPGERSISPSTAISTALCGAVATAGANRGRNTGGSEGLPLDPTGGSAAAVCPPAHRQRVCCKAQSRRIDCCSPSTAAVVGAGRVLSISCTCAKVTPESEQTASRASELEVWR